MERKDVKWSDVPPTEDRTELHQAAPPPAPGQVSVTSTSLLERLRVGDQESWQRLTKLYGSLVYSWCRQQRLQADDAADVVQDVFRAVADHLDQFQRDRPGDSFRRWLKTITNNRVRDHWRREKRRPKAVGGTEAQARMAEEPDPVDAPPGADEPGETDDAAERNHLLREALELVRHEFEPPTWQAFWQTVVDGRAAPDVAADLNMSANAVRIAKSRVRSRLRQEFDKLID